MSKSRSHNSELDQLREKIKVQDKLIKHLKREIAKARKNASKSVEEVEEELEHVEPTNLAWVCKACGKGVLVETSLGVRKLITCTVCNFRGVEK